MSLLFAVPELNNGVSLKAPTADGTSGQALVTNAAGQLSFATFVSPTRTVGGHALSADVALAVADISGAAPLASPTFTGTPAAPTAIAATNTTQIATTAYVKSQGYSTTTGTVTSVSVITASGVSGSVATATTTPAITLTLGAITPSSVAATGTVTGSNLSGTNTGNQTITLTGDVTGSGTASFAATLATINSNVGSFGSSTAIPVVTANGKGLITAISTAVVIAPAGTLTGTTLAANVVASSLTSVGTIATGVWNGTVVTAVYGGTGLATLTANAVLIGAGTGNVQFATIGTAGRLLIDQGAAANPSFNAMSGDATISSAGAITVTKTSGVSFGTLAVQSGIFSGTSSGTNTGDQTITLTGDVTGSGTGSFATTVAKIQTTTVSGTTGTTNVVFSASPTLTGTITASAVTLSSDITFTGTTHAGLLVNLLTTTQRDAISSPVNGMLVYNTTIDRFNQYAASAWRSGWARLEGDTFTGVIATSGAGAASTASLTLSGALFTGGSGTTTFPQLFIQAAGTTAATSYSTSGTYIGVNAVSGFAGNFLDFHVTGGVSIFKVASTGGATVVTLNTSSDCTVAGRLISNKGGAANTYAMNFNGAIFTGGTGTTNIPHLQFQTGSPTAVTTWSTAGTYLGVNADSGFAGNFLDFHVNGGTSLCKIDSAGGITLASSIITAAPSGGTAGAWKLGIRVAGVALALDTTQYVQLDVGGTAYKLAVTL